MSTFILFSLKNSSVDDCDDVICRHITDVDAVKYDRQVRFAML